MYVLIRGMHACSWHCCYIGRITDTVKGELDFISAIEAKDKADIEKEEISGMA